MTQKRIDVKEASLAQLIEAYVDTALEYLDAGDAGRYQVANRAFHKIEAIAKELILARGREGKQQVERLLEHERPGIRFWAAQHCIDFAPERSLAVLESLTNERGLVGIGSVTAIQEWKKGNWRPLGE